MLTTQKIYDEFLGGKIEKRKKNNRYITDLFVILNDLSNRKNEGAEVTGRIIFCSKRKNSPNILLLKSGIKINDLGNVRKFLEICGDELCLLCDGYEIFGIMKISKSSLKGRNGFSVIFKEKSLWDLEYPNCNHIMTVKDSIPSIPKQPISYSEFQKEFENVFYGEGDIKTLWSIIEQASKQEHGTMLVITDKAEEEAQRLTGHEVDCQISVFKNIVYGVTSIDGAVLLDPQGQCSAIGVILDGKSDEKIEDKSRGARYNSAVRYLYTYKEHQRCIIIVISEDGMINLLSNDLLPINEVN